MDGDEKRPGRERLANDNRAPDGQNAGGGADAFERLDAVVLSIARLIGRRMAREDYERAMRAANDTTIPKERQTRGKIIRVLMMIEAGRKRTLRLNSGYLYDI